MSIITLYHGTPNEFVTPQYGYGEDILTNAEKEIDKHIESLRAFSDIMVKQQERIVHLEKENMELKEQIQNLNAQLNQQHEQSQYHKHENEQDFGMYL